jgi:hypothetical protein
MSGAVVATAVVATAVIATAVAIDTVATVGLTVGEDRLPINLRGGLTPTRPAPAQTDKRHRAGR